MSQVWAFSPPVSFVSQGPLKDRSFLLYTVDIVIKIRKRRTTEQRRNGLYSVIETSSYSYYNFYDVPSEMTGYWDFENQGDRFSDMATYRTVV